MNCWQTYVLANKDAFEFLPTCHSDIPILGNFEFHQHYFKAINRYYVILSFYQHYVIAISRYYAILSVFAKFTLYRYNVKTDNVIFSKSRQLLRYNGS